MPSQYPIILVHGLAMKDLGPFKAFGKIEQKLNEAGYRVFTAKMDGFGAVETNAEQLKQYVLQVLAAEGVEKVNLIAHSKGGLDCKYMIEHLQMEGKVASLTTLCTPHGGAKLATDLLKLPKIIVGFLKVFLNGLYKVLGDEKPDALTAGQQLCLRERGEEEEKNLPQGVHFRSYAAKKDELVSEESAAFANYMGLCLEEPISHLFIVDVAVFSKKKRNRIYNFYLKLCKELTALGC